MDEGVEEEEGVDEEEEGLETPEAEEEANAAPHFEVNAFPTVLLAIVVPLSFTAC